jgi:hypothetical protein
MPAAIVGEQPAHQDAAAFGRRGALGGQELEHAMDAAEGEGSGRKNDAEPPRRQIFSLMSMTDAL